MTLPVVEIQKDTVEDSNDLINALEASCALPKDGKCFKRNFQVYESEKEVTNWKFKEYDYARKSVTLPINSRGLFTMGNRIVARGYDKFFNVNETESTKMESLEKLEGPFVLTLKENGCIILISGLEDGELLVCSKNSTGVREDSTKNHALAGRSWLEKQLAEVNKTPRELAEFLYRNNMVAMAEYCDDEFEEHVLQYNKESAGLYLHGINFNTREFKTLSMEYVDKFAEFWGFHKIEYFRIDTFSETLKLLKECEKTGTYNDREVEGFVVRCKKDNKDFFFKYKFEEPYLLYRQMREATKKLLAGNSSLPQITAHTHKRKGLMHRYLVFASDLFAANPELKEKYRNSQGIIETRKLFFEHIGLEKVSVSDLDKLNDEAEASVDTYKYVLIPVGTIGTGKTTVFQTLHYLFGWPHIQNDNLTTKGERNKLVTSCLEALMTNDVVLLDRNNHQHRERRDLIDSFTEKKGIYFSGSTQIRLIILNFVNESITEQDLWNITHERIESRGNNHQSIKYHDEPHLYDNVMRGFIRRFDKFDLAHEPDSEFDLCIDLELGGDSSLINTKNIIERLGKEYPDLIKLIPSDEMVKSKFQDALQYKPKVDKVIKVKQLKPVYIGVEIQKNRAFIDAVDSLLGDNDTFLQLQDYNRIQKGFHVTLFHAMRAKGDSNSRASWNSMQRTLKVKPSTSANQRKNLNFFADIKLKFAVVATDELVCVEVQALRIYDEDGDEVQIPYSNKYLHITVGTTSANIKPVESNKSLIKIHGARGSINEGEFNVSGKNYEVVRFDKPIVLRRQRLFAQY